MSNYVENLRNGILNCSACFLRKTYQCSGPVPWEGEHPSPLVIVGASPGEEEDLKKIPFVGEAGRFLTGILDKVGLIRRHLFLMNTVNCRPPSNRTPLPTEIEKCDSWFQQQLNLANPKLVLALGQTAAEKFMFVPSVGDIRGKVFRVNGRWVLPTWHPSGVLKVKSREESFRDDILLAAIIVWQSLKYPTQEPKAFYGPVLLEYFSTDERRQALKEELENLLKNHSLTIS